jgi:hypothetical protein
MRPAQPTEIYRETARQAPSGGASPEKIQRFSRTLPAFCGQAFPVITQEETQ